MGNRSLVVAVEVSVTTRNRAQGFTVKCECLVRWVLTGNASVDSVRWSNDSDIALWGHMLRNEGTFSFKGISQLSQIRHTRFVQNRYDIGPGLASKQNSLFRTSLW